MALFMNQILAYRISAEVKKKKKNIYKEKKTPNWITVYLAKMAQSTFRKRKKVSSEILLACF